MCLKRVDVYIGNNWLHKLQLKDMFGMAKDCYMAVVMDMDMNIIGIFVFFGKTN